MSLSTSPIELLSLDPKIERANWSKVEEADGAEYYLAQEGREGVRMRDVG